jgi:diaminohydroxyphosphoribosylaminopyrimidine deaminase/5-amino-6-(5-phosphoribosylamino)uracil reductase
VDAGEALLQLAADGVRRVLVEGGGKLSASLISGGLVDRLEWFRAPIVLGEEGRPSVAALALAKLMDAPRFRRVALRGLTRHLESYERFPDVHGHCHGVGRGEGG